MISNSNFVLTFRCYLLAVNYKITTLDHFCPKFAPLLPHLIKVMLGSIQHKKISLFLIYLLEDEHGLSLGMLIHLKRIYNFRLFRVIILSIL